MEQSDQDLISAFFNELQSLKGISDRSVKGRTWDLEYAASLLREKKGSLDTITTKQALDVVSEIRKAPLTLNTSRMCIATFKRFLLWRIENGAKGLNEKKIRQIKIPDMDYRAKKETDLLTQDEIETAINACRNSRDRAIIALLYDGSHRPIEIKNLLWRDLTTDQYGILVTTSEKTGKERFIRLSYAVPFLEQWRQDYPGAPSADAPVFMTLKEPYGPLGEGTLANLARELRKRTGNKKIKPSIFRPSRITHEVESGADLQYLMLRNWGHLKTRMLAVYAKPGKEYVDRVALERAGIKREKKRATIDKLKPIQCLECSTLNLSGAKFCVECGEGLTDESRRFLKYMDDMMSDPDKLRRWADTLEKRKANRKEGGIQTHAST